MTYHRPLSLTGISRRELLRRAAIAGAGLTGVAAIAGCGESKSTGPAPSSSGSSSSGGGGAPAPLTGSIEFLNYPQWIGPHEVKAFEQLHPGVKISQNNSAFTGSVSGTAVMVAQNPKQFDMLLADLPVIGQLSAGGFIADMDFSRIPNISLVAPAIRKLYTHGVPTDFGKMGIGYRTDMVKTPPKSWADLWRMAPQYKDKIVAYNLDRDMFGPALKYLGYSVNTRNAAELQKAKQALVELKASIKAFKAVDIASELVKGTAAIAMTNDYDVALAQTQNSKIGWVVPSEGTSGYLEGWVAVKPERSHPGGRGVRELPSRARQLCLVRRRHRHLLRRARRATATWPRRSRRARRSARSGSGTSSSRRTSVSRRRSWSPTCGNRCRPRSGEREPRAKRLTRPLARAAGATAAGGRRSGAARVRMDGALLPRAADRADRLLVRAASTSSRSPSSGDGRRTATARCSSRCT